jgi:hypothetical protein
MKRAIKLIVILLCCLISYGLLTAMAASRENQTEKRQSDVSDLLGDWSGESVCVNKEKFPACKDEVVVYHITKVAGKADTVHLSADKVVNGKPEFMGEFDFIYNAKSQALTGEFKNERVHLLIELIVKVDDMEGGMYSLPDKTQVRKIKVKKNK